MSDNWIRHVGDVAQKRATLLGGFPAEQRANRLCELNAIEQAENVCLTTVVQDPWPRGQKLSVHGWVYSLTGATVRAPAPGSESCWESSCKEGVQWGGAGSLN